MSRILLTALPMLALIQLSPPSDVKKPWGIAPTQPVVSLRKAIQTREPMRW